MAQVQIGVGVVVEPKADGPCFVCAHCGHSLGPAGPDRNYMQYSALNRVPLSSLGPRVDPYRLGADLYEARVYLCPACGTLYDVETALRDDDEIVDATPASSSLPTE